MLELAELFGEPYPMKRRHVVPRFRQRLKVWVLLNEADTGVGGLQTPEIVLEIVVLVCPDDGNLAFGDVFMNAAAKEQGGVDVERKKVSTDGWWMEMV